jgi:hypothetical protein
MSISAIAGVLALDVLLLAAGSGLLWGVRGWEAWSEFARLAGLAYLLGAAALGVLFVNELVVGIPFSLATVVLTALAVLAAGVLLGVAAGRRLPRLRARGRSRVGGAPLLSAAGAGLLALYLEAFFRAGRVEGLFEWDAMAFWVPKAKAIYYFGGLDQQFFSSLPGPSYPPLIPALESSSFEFMGGADAITLHLLFWSLFAGFLAAVAGLLAGRVRALFLWPVVLVVALTPELVNNALLAQADKLLDYFIALAALLLGLWLLERARWQLAFGGIFLAAAMLTKREGLLLAVCVAAAAMVASWRRWRSTWPALILVTGLAFAISRPWHHWFASRGIAMGSRAEGPAEGYFGFLHLPGRIWPALRLTLSTLFSNNAWLLATPLFVIGIAAAFVAGARLLPSFAGAYLLLGVLGCSWVTITTESGTLHAIVRFTGGLVLPVAGLLPLLLEAGWRGRVAEGAT